MRPEYSDGSSILRPLILDKFGLSTKPGPESTFWPAPCRSLFGDKRVMRMAHWKRLLKLGVGALLLLAVHGVCMSRSATAGCSRLVHSHSDRQPDAYGLDALIIVSMEDGTTDPGSPRPPSPCSGLSCSSRDSLPLSSATPGGGSSSEHGFVFPAPRLRRDSSCQRSAPDGATPLSTVEPSTIFHPPRD